MCGENLIIGWGVLGILGFIWFVRRDEFITLTSAVGFIVAIIAGPLTFLMALFDILEEHPDKVLFRINKRK